MTVILPEQTTCPECGHRFAVYVCHSQSNFGDEPPCFVHRGYARCPKCDHRTDKAGAIEFLSAFGALTDPPAPVGEPTPSEAAIRDRLRALAAHERIWNAPPPIPVTRSADDVLRELGVADASLERKREVVAEHAWRLRREEIRWLREAGLTDLTEPPPAAP